MAREKVSIFDMKDAEAYVRSKLPRVPPGLMSPEAREDLVQTGMMMLQEMKRKYQPGIGGRDPANSTFTGYVEGQHLGAKLGDQWKRLQDGRLTSDGKGGREWVFPDAPASLDQINERDGNLDSVKALRGDDVYDTNLAQKLARASDEQHEVDRDIEVKVGVMLGEEMPASVIAEHLGLREKEVGEAINRIIRFTPRLTTMEDS